MLLKEDTKSIQQQLAGYCRDGKPVEIEGARTERLPNYRRLVYNVVYGIIEKAFPVTESILSTPEFKSLVSEFFVQHDPQTPQVWKLPGEFFEFVEKSENPLKIEYPYLEDLMRMEWIEILVFNRENRPVPPSDPIKDLSNEILATNPNREVLKLEYPVFKGNYEEMSQKRGQFRLLIFRNLDTHKVHFIEMSAVHEILLTGLENGASFSAICDLIFSQLKLEPSADQVNKLRAFCERLITEGFILGAAQ